MPRICQVLYIVTLLVITAFCQADVAPEIVERGKRATALVEIDGGKEYGTAFCVDSAGFFVTNTHVASALGGSKSLILILHPGEKDQRKLTARVLRQDKDADLALLQADVTPGLTTLKLSRSDHLIETQMVVAFGYSSGKDLAAGVDAYPAITVSTGHITALRKSHGVLQGIQLDASLNPGNSGGPVLDAKGQVIGIVKAGIVGSGVNFAIPVFRLHALLSRIDLILTPMRISQKKVHEPQVFTIQMATFGNEGEGMTLDLILEDGSGPHRSYVATSADGHIFKVKAIPISPEINPISLQLTVHDGVSTTRFRVKDRPIFVGEKALHLSEIMHIQNDGKTTITLANGHILTGIVRGMKKLEAKVGDANVSLDLSKANDLFIEAKPINVVNYRIIARKSGSIVGEQTGALRVDLDLEGWELLVACFQTGMIEQFDAKTGGFLGSFPAAKEPDGPHNVVSGPDGYLYVSTEHAGVWRFQGDTLQPMGLFASGHGIDNTTGLAFGPDSNLYVGSAWNSQVLRFNGKTGEFMDVFVPSGRGGLNITGNLTFGPDGNLYVCSLRSNQIKRYNGTTGAFLDDVASGNGLSAIAYPTFGPDGNLYVVSGGSRDIKRFNSKTGEFIDNFIPAHSGGLAVPSGLTFGPDGNLYVCCRQPDMIKRYDGKTGAYIDDFLPIGRQQADRASMCFHFHPAKFIEHRLP